MGRFSLRPILLTPMAAAVGVVILAAAGCGGIASSDDRGASRVRAELVWGRRGLGDGEFQKPRAMAIDAEDLLYVVDMQARIQVFDADGRFQRGWQTPASKNGRPTGLSIGRDGNVLVADTHYFRMLVYTPEGRLLESRTIGGTSGQRPGEFGFVTSAVEDSRGNYYIAEYGEFDRIQKFSPDGKFLFQWGGHGSLPGQFIRPQKMVVDADGHLWVADACNHRIQVFDARADAPGDKHAPPVELIRVWGDEGTEPGQLKYPYDLALDGKGHVYVCEFGNHRVQKFTLDGTSLGCWGTHGRKPGELFNPWALVVDSKGRVHVLDTGNNRVQRVEF